MSSGRDLRSIAFPAVLITGGVAALVIALAAGAIGLGDTAGIGAQQLALAAVGLVAAVLGVILVTPAGQRYLRDRGPLPPEEPERLGWSLAIAVWMGLVAALPEVSLSLLQKLLGHRFLGISSHSAWMTPIPYVALFLFVCLLLALLAALGVRRALHLSTIAFSLSFLALFSILLQYHPELHLVAIALLGAGIAAELAKLLSRHRKGFHQLVARTTLPLVLLVIAAGVLWPVLRDRAERRATLALPAPAADAPNVLLIILDTVRSATLSLYGYERPTSPHLERLASGGVVFANAFSTAPWTLPSHASIFTGHQARDVSADWDTPLDDAQPTLAELLRDRGYRTGGFVGNRLYAGPHSGLGRGFLRYDADVISVSEILRSASFGRFLGESDWFRRLTGYEDVLGRKHAQSVSGQFLDWLGESRDRPFFAFLNYYDAHDPYLPPRDVAARFETTERRCVPADISAGTVKTEADLVQCLDAYAGAIANLDAHLAQVFEELQRRGLLDNTVVIITSDHGEEFGEHGLANHGRSLYLPALHIPLLISYAERVPAGAVVNEPVSVRDIPATVLDLLGVDSGELVPGRSLARYWTAEADSAAVSATGSAADGAAGDSIAVIVAETSGREWLAPHNPVSRGDIRSLIIGDMHYILNGDGAEELYRISTDPWEQDNLVDRPELAGELHRFRSVMDQVIP